MSNCISHTGLYDDLENPLDIKGNLYRPGVRTCGYRDCVNQNHIQGLRKTRTGGTHARYSSEDFALIKKLGDKPNAGQPVCAFTNCELPNQARNLCSTHWRSWRRLAQNYIPIPRLNLRDFPPIPEPRRKGWRKGDSAKLCLLSSCSNESRRRSLCPNHYKIYDRLVKEKQWKSIQSASVI